MILFINACVWKDSRTKRLADHLLGMMDGPVEEVKLVDIKFPVVDIDFLDRRDSLKARGDYSDPIFDLARQFAAADTIVIAAPYWDLSFPASLKAYFEQINVNGMTFAYSETGELIGLCKASKLYYITTSGGDYAPDEYGYGYVKSLANGYYGIPETSLIKAVGLDIAGADTEGILQACIEQIKL